MEPELVALATAGATTVINAMASEAWSQVRASFARIFAKQDAAVEAAVVHELEEAREALLTTQPHNDALRERLTQQFASQLQMQLLTSPQTREQARKLVSEFGDRAGSADAAARDVRLDAVARDSGRVYQVGQGNQFNL
ncbi:hypothetical protein OOK41_04360 [Micromonospora sp. NBC_01655]|uniref:hypothetical protein n=1 Tax=Micromonospora sp. NBC_01655 TaxID=2975983 RepID=UPI0022568E00|nr:hypothetical protein [Micromonospora sp. NBC_01655]MCX4469539.1 hypothetical protein [Micromonospora sp. NBC_01655]